MRYLYGKTKQFPIVIEEFKSGNYKNYLVRVIKDFVKTLIFNFSKKNYFPNNCKFALNNDGVIEQDYFSNSNEWVNIISVQRLKKF